MSKTLQNGLPDIVNKGIAISILIVTSPLILLLALLVKTTSKGPAFFIQTRVGKEGKHFSFYKLRTMRVDNKGAKVTARGDSRITSIGYYLRKTKLDELPQLLNVIKGDIALVGPRPEVPDLVDLKDQLWRRVLSTKPGITDPVSLLLRDEEKLLPEKATEREQFYKNVLQPFKLKGYVEYLEQRTWLTDLQIIGKSLLVFFKNDSEVPPELKNLPPKNSAD